MDPREVKTLLLLEAIAKEQCQSQRELSKKIRMSLGLVNTFIKQLTIRKIFKRSDLPGNRVRYTLTSKGIVEKAELKRKYLEYSIEYYKEIKRRVAELFSILAKSGKRKFIFYGAGELCEIACIIIGEDDTGNVNIIDDKKAGRKICGHEIYKEAQLEYTYFDALIIMDYENYSFIRNYLINKGIPVEKIYNISLQ